MKMKLLALLAAMSLAASLVAQTFPRASNLSTRMRLPAGETLIVGFNVVDGPKTFVIRAVGPTLAQFGVTGAMSDPQLELFSADQRISGNDNHVSGSGVAPGAFPLPAGSRDAAIRITLEPGAYTIQAKGVNAQIGGEVLVEIYEVP